MYIWEVKTQNMKKQLLFSILIFFISVTANSKDRGLTNNSLPRKFITSPTNDNCNNATNVPINTTLEVISSVSGTTFDATPSNEVFENPCFGNQYQNDVWFSFIATAKKHIISFSNISSQASQVYYNVYSGSCSNLEVFHCGIANDLSMSVIEDLIIGVNYKIRVVVFNNTALTFNLALTTPATVLNNECNASIVIPVNPNMEVVTSLAGDIQGATPSATPLGCFTDSGMDDMWYKFVATSGQHILKVDATTGVFFYIDLFSGTNCSNSIHINCWTEQVKILDNLEIGTTYRIKISNGSYYPSTIPIIFNVSITTPPTLPNDDCDFSIHITVNPALENELFAEGASFGANESSQEIYCSGNTKDVWFDFTALSGSHIINFYDMDESVNSIRYSLYYGDDCNELIFLGCSSSSIDLFNNFVVGQNYKLRVQNYLDNTLFPGIFKIAITTPVLPANDNCENAINVPINPNSSSEIFLAGTTYAATSSSQPSTCQGENDDVWYSFVATANLHMIKVKSTELNGAYINHSLFSGDDCDTLAALYCGSNISLANNLIIGNTYKIRIYSGSNSINGTVSFELSITTPPTVLNDECSNATPILVSEALNPIIVSGGLTGATASPQSSTCTGYEDDDVWYEFVATSTKSLIRINNVQGLPSTDLVHSLFSGNCEGLMLKYCSDSDISIATNLVVGETYKIRIWSKQNGLQSPTYDFEFDIAVIQIHPPLVANTTQFTTEQLVSTILVNNPCVDISNITSSTGTNFDSVNGIGYFTNNNPYFPLNSGLVLSTGSAAYVGGPNLTNLTENGSPLWFNAGDEDLESIIQAATGAPMTSRNTTKLEFDFTSQNEIMSFNFLFASEEYGVFQCNFADAFAFLLTDLVTGDTKNLAAVPGTDIPVSVVTVRDEEYNPSCISQNEPFFDTFFEEALAQTAATNFNGQTALMSASSQIIANRPYHIKLVIADRQDGSYDSAVFIQAGSFSSGPPQCTDKVQLVAFIDENNNGAKEDTESSFTYGSFVYQINNTGDINNISSPIGNYTIYDSNPLNSYDFSYEVHPEYANYFSSGIITHNDISIAVGSGTQTLYFPITQIQGYNDVTVSIVPVGQPTAGFSYTNKIVYTNLGTSATSGTINYTKDPLVTVASTQAGVVNSSDGFTYNFVNLGPFETRSFNFTINVPSIPMVNIDDVLESSVAISAPSDDINSSNNIFTNSQIVVASYDPNDKMEAHGDKLDINNFNQDDYLFYTIRFQNTGTANAINIRIEDELDAQLDEESIRMVSASHNYVMDRVGNKLVWKFDYIYLPSMLASEELSNGYLIFKIKVKPGFEVGDIIPNFAEIYFDTNPAIITNIFNSTFGEQLSTPEFSSGNVLIYPNPSNGLVYINTQNTNENLQAIHLYDVLGKTILSSKNLSAKEATIDVSSLAKAVYMIEITTENNFKQIKKLVVN